MTTAVERLTAILRGAKATPTLHDDAVAPSVIYDASYRVTVIALTMHICGKDGGNGTRLMPAAKLKLFQFVAVRSELLPNLRQWLSAHLVGAGEPLERWQGFPRGYAADALHERVLTYLFASGELAPKGKSLLSKPGNDGLLAKLVDGVRRSNTFTIERRTLQELQSISPKITMKRLGA